MAPGSDNVARCVHGCTQRPAATDGSLSSLEDDGRERLQALRAHGFDLGIANPVESDTRLEAIYAHARDALYAGVDEGADPRCGHTAHPRADRCDQSRPATSRSRRQVSACETMTHGRSGRSIRRGQPHVQLVDLGWPQCQRRQRTPADTAARIASRAFAAITTSVDVDVVVQNGRGSGRLRDRGAGRGRDCGAHHW